MCLASMSIDAAKDGPFVAHIARTTAQELRAQHPELPVIAARFDLLAHVIDALIERAELAEGQAKVNAQTVIRQQHEMRKLERNVQVRS